MNHVSPCLPHMPPAPADLPRLFCFPYAGGSAGYYRQWQPLLQDTARVCPVELPGRASRYHDPLPENMDSLTSELGEALLPFTNEPYIFFGHSLGSCLAFAVIQYLSTRGARLPMLLFASGRYPAHLQLPRRTFHLLDDEEFIDELRRLGGTPEDVLTDPAFKEYFLPVIRNDFMLIETHVSELSAPLPVPIAVLGGTGDMDSPPCSLEKWGELSSSGCSVKLFDGGHFFIDSKKDQVILEIKRLLSAGNAACSE